jgi:putative intracellular protease/amidase
MHFFQKIFLAVTLLAPIHALAQTAPTSTSPSATIAPYEARFGRERPVIAVVGSNAGTELSDFMAPYAILARSGAAEVLALATAEGPMQMRPTLRIAPHATLAGFDQRFADGADYVIVPAVVNPDDPVMLAWLAQQASKGATIVSICDGALVAARAGVFKGRRATGHWATHTLRQRDFPDTQWLTNVRYVADGKVVSSAGISAAIPVALALVEAIAGRARADAVAAEVNAADWGDRHNSALFRRTTGMVLTAIGNTVFRGKARIGIPLEKGMDELALALYADAASRTYRSKAYALGGGTDPIVTRHGLPIFPELGDDARSSLDHIQPMGQEVDTLKKIIARIDAMYGSATGRLVAAQMEFEQDGANF